MPLGGVVRLGPIGEAVATLIIPLAIQCSMPIVPFTDIPSSPFPSLPQPIPQYRDHCSE